ncbi:alfa-L-rhamnosidase [Lachnospiraceae bacterium KM106-2]|nr:alfa-L-rhamnosidase [Lachnospiraceae bacterium KM106-2]
MEISELRVNHIERPMGFCLDPFSFSWKVTKYGEAKRQKYARIEVRKEDSIIFDSGKDVHADSLDYPVNIVLEPRTRYEWSVTVKAENGDVACASSFFETGKMNEKWIGKWIKSTLGSKVSPIMERTIYLDGDVLVGRSYLCGLGVYEYYINGEKVGKEFLAPGYHSYDLHLQVQTYDVTDHLKAGENKVEVILGDGWFKGRLGFEGGYENLYGDAHYLIWETHVIYKDGRKESFGSDEQFRCRRSNIIANSIYDGEVYDAREQDKEEIPVLVEEPEKVGSLVDRYSLPMVKKESFTPIQMIITPKGEKVLDFGQNLTGWVEIEQNLPYGESIKLTASEILQDGCFYHDNLRLAKTEYEYISDGIARRVRPHFTFYGFRYMKVDCEEPIKLEQFRAYHLRSDFDQIGWIKTGNHLVNQLFSNALWSQKDNFLDVPTDCPQRDERLGWTGDAQVFSDTACFNMHMPAFYRKYMWDMRAEQSLIKGAVPNVVPRIKKDMIGEYGSCPWGDAGVIIPWNVYRHYGSKTLLAEMYPGMKAWVEYQRENEVALGGPHLIKSGFHFADWLALDNKGPGPFGATNSLFVASAYYYRGTLLLAKSAGILSNLSTISEKEKHDYQMDREKYEELAKQIHQDILIEYFDEQGHCKCETQTARALTIMFGLGKDNNQTEGELLDQLVKQNNNHLNTGFVGTPLLCPALAKTGHFKTAIDLLLNEEYPGWLYCVKLGATTIWERWNSVMPDGHMNSEGMNSLNHYSYGSIEAFMYEYVAGIGCSEEQAGYRTIHIEPHPDERLGFVEGKLNGAAGMIVSNWHYGENKKVFYEMEIPFHTDAEVLLPEGNYLKDGQKVNGNQFTLEPGYYQFQEL